MRQPWLIGEHNPYGELPRRALFPLPPQSAGGRLCARIFGMTVRDYLRSFARRNLLSSPDKRPRWRPADAREAASEIAYTRRGLGDDQFVLLGERVAAAFGVKYEPFLPQTLVLGVAREATALVLPHPSGRCRAWNDPDSVPRARGALLLIAPELAAAVGSVDREEE